VSGGVLKVRRSDNGMKPNTEIGLFINPSKLTVKISSENHRDAWQKK
jgi:hypothetical protein